jgi:hypothetical protein
LSRTAMGYKGTITTTFSFRMLAKRRTVIAAAACAGIRCSLPKQDVNRR